MNQISSIGCFYRWNFRGNLSVHKHNHTRGRPPIDEDFKCKIVQSCQSCAISVFVEKPLGEGMIFFLF